jgi:ATP-binding cassette subfamily F protein uup
MDAAPKAAARPAPVARAEPAARANGLSFTEKKRLDDLPDLIARLESEIGKLGALLEDPELFTREPVKFRKASEAMAERQSALEAAESEWLDLAERA